MEYNPDLPQFSFKKGKIYRLGIMGGTFDPIHYGHLVAAEQASGELSLDTVLFMPAGKPAFKSEQHVSPAQDRYAMALLATAANPKFFVTQLEIARHGTTYTADTLQELRAYYPKEVELFFITGADALLDIAKWRDARKIADMATFVGATRPGYDLDAAEQSIKDSGIPFSVRYLEVPALSISSSALRARHRAHLSLRYLTPDSVIGYIEKHHLYEGCRESHRPAAG